jgi:hypothetical protein
MRGIYGVRQWDVLKCHDIHTKFHGVRFRHSSNIKGNISIILEAEVLVLMTRGTFEVLLVMGPDGKTSIPSFMTIGWDIQLIRVIMLLPLQFEGLQCWCYWWEGFMNYVAEKGTSPTMYTRNLINSSTDGRRSHGVRTTSYQLMNAWTNPMRTGIYHGVRVHYNGVLHKFFP